ncbi:flagellar assembly protein FliW [Gracilibacillus marinus]|jgi:flagellar assembly factor FliW|uniref:Flagellar assembly factor FliW n=1 Tax=Gracilibacillus marinus TaxID=630535 RepID=A0ABV8VS40_9BACI
MQIETKYFGQLDVKEEEIITFPNGIPGFIEEKSFVLLPFDEGGLFQVLQSTNGVDPAFIVVDPFLFVKEYQIELDDATLEQLEIEKEQQVRIVSIVTVKEPLTASTANLKAPIVINQEKQIAKQVLTLQTTYETREKIFNKTSKEEVE